MQVSLKIGKKTKWALIGGGLFLLGILLSFGNWEYPTLSNVLSLTFGIVGGLVLLVVLIIAFGEDFSGNNQQDY
jgi:hypothetical protein